MQRMSDEEIMRAMMESTPHKPATRQDMIHCAKALRDKHGKTPKEIAALMQLSVRTIQQYLKSAMVAPVRVYTYTTEVRGPEGVVHAPGDEVLQAQDWRGHWRDVDALRCVGGELCSRTHQCSCRNCTIYREATK